MIYWVLIYRYIIWPKFCTEKENHTSKTFSPFSSNFIFSPRKFSISLTCSKWIHKSLKSFCVIFVLICNNLPPIWQGCQGRGRPRWTLYHRSLTFPGTCQEFSGRHQTPWLFWLSLSDDVGLHPALPLNLFYFTGRWENICSL